jgi:hypothetical protein
VISHPEETKSGVFEKEGGKEIFKEGERKVNKAT